MKKIKNKFLCYFLMLLMFVFCIGNLKMLSNYVRKDEIIIANFTSEYMSPNNDISMSEVIDDEIEYVKLYRNNNEYNQKFNVDNMFPGDIETNYYCVNVSYKDEITLKYSASIMSDYQKVDEVFNVRVKLLNTDEILYDGLIKDISDTIDYSVSSVEKTADDFCYEISVYLDTSVGNEYQNKKAFIDFKWVVDNYNLEEEINSPSTVDNIMFWIGLAIVSVILLLFILLISRIRRKRLI